MPTEPTLPPAGDALALPPRRTAWLVMLALVALVVAGTGAWLVARQRDLGAELSRSAPGVLRVVEPEGDVAAPPTVLRWRALPGAARYDVQLRRGDGRPLFAAATPDTALALPDSVRLSRGADYVWVVSATPADGRARARVTRFRVAGR